MKNKQTAVEWIEEQVINNKDIYIKDNTLMIPNDIFRKAKQMEKEQEYETKAFWFGRGMLAEKENRIEELKPNKD